MHIYFSGIGGAGLSSLALLAKSAGHEVSGSDTTVSINTKMLQQRGIKPSLKQTADNIASLHATKPIDWIVISAAIPNNHPELKFAQENNLKLTKRHELIRHIVEEKQMKLVAVSGTHGKTTTSSMLAWLGVDSNSKVSYVVGSNPTFGPSGHYEDGAKYLIIEADEYDRNMLQFEPFVSVITSLDFDHPDTYEDKRDYVDAFRQFAEQSERVITWDSIATKLENVSSQSFDDDIDTSYLSLNGAHNRKNAFLALQAANILWPELGMSNLTARINQYPGVERRFELLSEGVYSDYAHHPEEIKATIQLAKELSSKIVVVYQPHQNIRQHHIRDQYTDCFEGADKVYWLPTYLTRENDLEVLRAEELTRKLTNSEVLEICELGSKLKNKLKEDLSDNALIVFMGAGDIDDWARENFLN